MCNAAGISGFKTNHSLRATAATRLYQSRVDEQLVMERTGHRSIDGIRSYKRTADFQRENVSDILNCNGSKRVCTVSMPLSMVSKHALSMPLSMVSKHAVSMPLPIISKHADINLLIR